MCMFGYMIENLSESKSRWIEGTFWLSTMIFYRVLEHALKPLKQPCAIIDYSDDKDNNLCILWFGLLPGEECGKQERSRVVDQWK